MIARLENEPDDQRKNAGMQYERDHAGSRVSLHGHGIGNCDRLRKQLQWRQFCRKESVAKVSKQACEQALVRQLSSHRDRHRRQVQFRFSRKYISLLATVRSLDGRAQLRICQCRIAHNFRWEASPASPSEMKAKCFTSKIDDAVANELVLTKCLLPDSLIASSNLLSYRRGCSQPGQQTQAGTAVQLTLAY
jgi:hypothetical protein